jgi:hypothetical protein
MAEKRKEMQVLKTIREFQDERFIVLRKCSWDNTYQSVDGGKSWVCTALLRKAFAQTPEADWLRFTTMEHFLTVASAQPRLVRNSGALD